MDGSINGKGNFKMDLKRDYLNPKLSSFGQKGSPYHPDKLIIGVSATFGLGTECYFWCLRVGNELRYFSTLLSNINGNREQLCGILINEFIESNGGGIPAEVYIFRDISADLRDSAIIQDEIRGIQFGLYSFYQSRPNPQPELTFTTITQGEHEWNDFTLRGRYGFGTTSYVVNVYPPNWNMPRLSLLCVSLAFGTGYVRLVWKAKNLMKLLRLRYRYDLLLHSNDLTVGHEKIRLFLGALDNLILRN